MHEDNPAHTKHANSISSLYRNSPLPFWRAHADYCDRVAAALNIRGIAVEPVRIEAGPRLYLAQLTPSSGTGRAWLRWTETAGWSVSQPEQERHYGAQPDQVDVLSGPDRVAAWAIDVMYGREAVLAPRDWRSATDPGAPTAAALRFEEHLLRAAGARA